MQKIVISANIKGVGDSPRSHAKVQYQWHWRRILAVFLVLVTLLYGAVIAFESLSQTDNEVTAPVIKNVTANLKVTEQTVIRVVDNQAQVELPQATLGLLSKPTKHGIEHALPVQPKPVKTEATKEVQQAVAKPQLATVEISTSNEKPIVQKSNTNSEQKSLNNELTQVVTDVELTDKPRLSAVALGAAMNTAFVSRALLTTKVEKHEPINVLARTIRITEFEQSLYFFTDVKNLNNQTVYHRWYYNDTQLAEIELAIYSNQYRTFSSKRILHNQLGTWRVELVNEQSEVLAKKEFTISN